jgi:cellobiose phosphorylase
MKSTAPTDMDSTPTPPGPLHPITSPSGLAACFNANGSLRALTFGAGSNPLCLHLFPGNAMEAGSTQLVLRAWPGATPHGAPQVLPLLGPASPARWHASGDRFVARGEWEGLAFELTLLLAQDAPAWFWHLALRHTQGPAPRTVDLLLQQDIALAPHGAVRLNEYYVSHYLDFTPLEHPQAGRLLAVRQNLPTRLPSVGPHPWALVGSLRHAVAHATDALQVLGRGHRSGELPEAWAHGLPGARLQQEHAMAALQDAPLTLAPGEHATLGFFGGFWPDHPEASGPADLGAADALLALPEAKPPRALPADALHATWQAPLKSLFSHAPRWPAHALGEADCTTLFGTERLQAEHGPDGTLWSFFTPLGEHVVLPAKERAVLRPHGHLLRSGEHLVPDEAAMTSTCWMAGVFHSMVCQGHVSLNRLTSTVHGMLGQYRSQGLRIFVQQPGGGWALLDQPSAFVMGEREARWLYRTPGPSGDPPSLIEVRAEADPQEPELGLQLRVLEGTPRACLVTLHLALNGDDGEAPGTVEPTQRADGSLWLAASPGTDLHARFPTGGFLMSPASVGTRFAAVGGAELVFADHQAHGVPMLALHCEPTAELRLVLRGELVDQHPTPVPHLHSLTPPRLRAGATAVQSLSTVLPWFQHNALVHYLAPRGLEQYSGGGWGTRDVCQGPVELLLAQGCLPPVRDLLARVFSAQDAGGDWPQWFMFFERDRHIRAGDSHGDIVFWPLLALGQYLLASGDASLLDEPLPFHAAGGAPPETAPLWQHVERALAVIAQRRIAGTALAAYGHGDWNDSLQPADPHLREHLCSAWTVTLHAQVLDTLADALALLGQPARAAPFRHERAAVEADFRRLLMPDGVVTGYALFDDRDPAAAPQPLLHPRDTRTGVRYSVLPMVHAVLSGLFTPEEATRHAALVEQHLLGPDGARLFDAPFPYRGGPMQLFQRAESSSYFGREIGLMYTHAHLRYAEALAHLGHAEAFWHALGQAHPIGLRERVPSAAPRQANCYYSSSDAAFADRAQASAGYARALAGQVPLEGGWRIYSSGAGIALGLVQRCLLGLRPRADTCVIDPVLPPALSGLQAETRLAGQAVTLEYTVGPRGHGPLTLELNGTPLPFTREANPYREGGARIDWATMAPLWGAHNRLRVQLG